MRTSVGMLVRTNPGSVGKELDTTTDVCCCLAGSLTGADTNGWGCGAFCGEIKIGTSLSLGIKVCDDERM